MTGLCPRAAACALMLFVVSGSPASPGAPTEALRHSIDRIFALLDDPAFKGGDRAVERQRELFALADSAVDFSEAARLTLGATWDRRTPAERAQFVRLFADLIAHAYLKQYRPRAHVREDRRRHPGGVRDARGRRRAVARLRRVVRRHEPRGNVSCPVHEGAAPARTRNW
jgi:MlaC protein